MEIAKANNAGVVRIELQNIFLVLVFLAPIVGIFVNYFLMWGLMFFVGLLWIIFTRKEVNSGLLFMWGVEFEPSPSDFVFAGSWLKRIISGQIRWFSNPALVVLFVFSLVNIAQIFYSASIERGIFFAIVTIYTISLAFYFAGYVDSVDKWREVKRFYLLAVLISALILVFMILLLYLQGRMGRPAGFFKDPNVAGAFMATGALYAMSIVLFGEREKILKFTLLFLFLFLSIVLTFSRGALLNLIVGILTLGLISLFTGRWKRFAIVIAIGIVIALLSVPFVLDVFKQSFRFRGATWYDIYGRAMAWQSGIQMVKDYPLGVGPGQFEHYSLDYQKSFGGVFLRLTPSAHNLYLRVAVENGIIGFSAFVFAILVLLGVGVRYFLNALKLKSSFLLSDLAWLFSSILGILAQSFVIDTLHWRHFWILIGFMISCVNLEYKKISLNE